MQPITSKISAGTYASAGAALISGAGKAVLLTGNASQDVKAVFWASGIVNFVACVLFLNCWANNRENNGKGVLMTFVWFSTSMLTFNALSSESTDEAGAVAMSRLFAVSVIATFACVIFDLASKKGPQGPLLPLTK